MASYRNSFSNYYSDKTGNHAPVGTILPVFADVNLAANDPDYTYPQHLYCDGKELLIRDYPELYSIIENRYGGGQSVAKTQNNQPGGLRRSYIINNKLFFQFYYDATNDKANVKRPYPYGSVFRFSTATNAYGAFPSAGIFNQNTFYGLELPTEDVTAQAQTNEFAYELTLPDSVDLSTVTSSDYTKNFTGSDTHPLIIIQKSFSLLDYPYNVGTFNLPDYRQRKILGFGNVNGTGTSTPENAVNNFVGQTGGQWYIAKNSLIDSGEFFVIGDVKTTGYASITADVAAYITGTVKYQVGPMDDYVFPFPPTHGHRMLSVEVDETKLAEQGATEADKFAVNYINSRANVNIFEPNGTAGGALGHSHGLIGTPLQNSQTATYGNTNGIGETAGDSGDAQYQYMVSESASINVTSMTYDANTGYITINTDGSHNLSVGDIVTVNGAQPLDYSGNFTIVADTFGIANFNVLPRDGEIPASSPATGTITVKLANGYFIDSEIVQPPKAYVIDTNTLVGGKQVVYDIPGTSITIKEETLSAPGATIATTPNPSLGEVTGTFITMRSPGGGGADSDTDGANAGYAEVGVTVNGNFYVVRVNGGQGGTAGNSGGAGGAGGSIDVPQALLDIDGVTVTSTAGTDGADGGYPGNGNNDALGGQGFSGGGNGTAQIKNQTNTDPAQLFTSNGSWTIPTVSNTEISRSITIELSGGGGGAGNANANSGCTSNWPGWPTSTTGKSGACGGYGGKGSLLVGTGGWTAGTLDWQLGQGGNVGFNRRSGTSGAGTPGNDPATGQPWGPPWSGGVGTGYEPDGNAAAVQGASGALSGIGAQGAWGNGATAASGGGVSGLYYNGVLIAGAGGGGGGGGSGGGNNGAGTVDGCYPGGDASGPAQALIATSGVLDVANGGNGSSGGCSAGGGGGGGSSCGIINVTPGGVGGQAGVGHNGNGGGTGGQRGISAYRTTYWQGGVSESANGADPTQPGYVRITFSNVTTYYDPVGGGAGQGGSATLILQGVNADVTMNLQDIGQGGGNAGDGNGGEITVQYYGQEEGTQVPGDITSPAGKYYECDSTGDPQGTPFDANVWISSTDDGIKQRQFGVGTGNNTGFAGGTAIPFNTNLKINQYIAFTGNASDAGGKRQLEVGTFNLTNANAVRFTIIRGSDQNGGENPDQAINIFYKKGTSNNVTLFSQILLASNSNPQWQTVDLPIAEGDQMRANDITLILEQDRGPIYQSATETDDNYGLGAITFFFDPVLTNTFVSTGGATMLGNVDVGGQEINSDDGIDQVRREVSAVGAALTVTDGVFTMSSSTPITTTATSTAENNIPLITKYHRVKYLIKAL